jgi:hypothetical protein
VCRFDPGPRHSQDFERFHSTRSPDATYAAAAEKAKDHAVIRDELLWKARRLSWGLAFLAAQLMTTAITVLRAVTI